MQEIGETAAELQKLAIGDVAFFAVLAQPTQRELVAASPYNMAVQRVVGDVEPAGHSQLGAHRPPVERLPDRVIVAQIGKKALVSRPFRDDVPGHPLLLESR